MTLPFKISGNPVKSLTSLTFKPSLVKHKVTSVYENLEKPLIRVLQKMEETGVLVDRTHLQTMSNSLEKKMAELELKHLENQHVY